MAEPQIPNRSKRLGSLDAYRGLVMLAMASSGFAFAKVLDENLNGIVETFESPSLRHAWLTLWQLLAYQFSHGAWTGCSFWDLIQPSFMFMVGVSMPFSYSKRAGGGQSGLRMFWHVIVRSLLLILLAIFLTSMGNDQTTYMFTNVLAQIGLGYTFLYLLWRRHLVVQLLALAGILGGYWYYFYQYTIPESEYRQVRTYLSEELETNPDKELDQFSGIAAHWNKHTNAAAAADRRFLSRYPREEKPWNGRTFWINQGGYQTLNFIPSIATMLFGVMAGRLIRSDRSERRKLIWLFTASGLCFVSSMAVDTTIWPVEIPGCDWSFCPIVKRIWSPSWAVFSAGWTFSILAVLYWLIDVRGWKRWSFPLVVVGMNSIAMYLMAQTLKPFLRETMRIHLGRSIFGGTYGAVAEAVGVVFLLWLICLWLYRRKFFIRI